MRSTTVVGAPRAIAHTSNRGPLWGLLLMRWVLPNAMPRTVGDCA